MPSRSRCMFENGEREELKAIRTLDANCCAIPGRPARVGAINATIHVGLDAGIKAATAGP